MAFSTYLEDKVLNHVLRSVSYTPPNSVWLALFTADNGLEDGDISGEVSGGSYARLEVGGTSGRSFTDSSSGSSLNNEQWEFPESTAEWGLITHFALMDAETDGNVLIQKELPADMQRTILTGDIYYIKSGNLEVTLD